jgi:hypothetical protein
MTTPHSLGIDFLPVGAARRDVVILTHNPDTGRAGSADSRRLAAVGRTLV